MIVYVESNFVLELAFLQEEHESCSSFLSLSESGDIRLVLPAFSIGEPYETLERRAKQRRELHSQLRGTIRELSRSSPYQESAHEFRDITGLLLRSGEEEKHRINETLERILQTVEVIPIDLRTIRAAITLQKSRSLSPQDALVYASILDHLKKEEADSFGCFITKDSTDFANPDIENDLAAHNCKLLTKFVDGLGYIRSRLKP